MIRVQAEDFDPGLEMAELTKGRTDVGALCSFVGLVRDFGGGSEVKAMTLEHYPGMTEKQLAKIEAEANERWPLQDSLIIHRYAQLGILDEEGFPMDEMGVMTMEGDNVVPLRSAGASEVMPGKRCPECGNYAVIKKDGCDFCTACGAQGACG